MRDGRESRRRGTTLLSRGRLRQLAAAAAFVSAAACGDSDPGVSGPAPVPNRGPRAVGTIPARTLSVGESTTVDVSPYFNDADGDPLVYAASSSNAGVVGVSVSGSFVVVAPQAKGVVTITVTARDPQGLTAQQSFQVTVPNQAPEPVGTIPDQTVFTGATVAVDVSVHFRDPDGDPLNYTAASSDEQLVTATVAGATITIHGVAPGTATVAVSATDGEGGGAHQTVRVTVPNRGPEAVDLIPGLTVPTGDTAVVAVSPYFHDPDGDQLSYSATSSAPGFATVAVSDTVLTVVGVAAGTARITVTARDPYGLIATSSFELIVETSASGFHIELVFATPMTRSQEAAFERAAERWMTILAPTELPDQTVNGTLRCGSDPRFERHVETIDDLVIAAAVGEIDGPGGILASAGPCNLRAETTLPFYGRMEFDLEDLERNERSGDLEEVILHEMGHVLGIGLLWNHFGLLRNPASETESPDTHFIGPLAIEAFEEAGGTDYEGGKVPVENSGGEGTRNGHWRETVLVTELMTGYVTGGTSVPSPLSAITIQSLADLGYVVDVTAADPYRLPDAEAARALKSTRRIPYGDDIWRGPIVVVDRDGRIVRVIPG